jgi:hypothetical protein
MNEDRAEILAKCSDVMAEVLRSGAHTRVEGIGKFG